jgi:amino acid transporter
MVTTNLARILNRWDLICLFLGSVIGSGIFLVPHQVMRHVDHSAALALGAWLTGGVLALAGALTFGELAAAAPAVGGPYVFLRDGFGRPAAFLYGWVAFLAGCGASIATLGAAFSSTLAVLLPGTVLVTPLAQKLLSLTVIALLALVNLRGTRQGANVQNWSTAIKVGALLVMSAVLLALGRGDVAGGPTTAVTGSEGPLASGFGLAMIGILWAYSGWQEVACCAGETVEARRTFPQAALMGVAAVIGIYMIANVGYVAALGSSGLGAAKNAAAAGLGVVLGPWAAKLVTLTVLVSILGAMNSNYLTKPRIFFAMAHDGLFYRKLAEVHPNFGTPAFAIVAGALSAVPFALTGTFEQLLTYFVFATAAFDVLVAACVFSYRRRWPTTSRPYHVPGYPWTPLAFILATLTILGNLMVTKPRDALVGLAILGLGLPAYWIWHARQNRKAAPAPHGEATLQSSE